MVDNMKWVKELKEMSNDNLIDEMIARQKNTLSYDEMLKLEVFIRLLKEAHEK